MRRHWLHNNKPQRLLYAIGCSLALFILHKLSLHRMPSASYIHNPASVLGISALKLEQGAAIGHFMEGKDVFIALYIATDYRNSLFSFASPIVFDRVGVVTNKSVVLVVRVL